MKKGPLKIYIAGPILGKYKDEPHPDVPFALHEVTRIMNLNVEKAIQAALQVMRRGHIPFVPHLNYYLHIHSDIEFPRDYWLDYDNTWLDLCDALLYLAPCNGADRELARAKSKKLKIFYNLSEIPNLWTKDIPCDFIKVVSRTKMNHG